MVVVRRRRALPLLILPRTALLLCLLVASAAARRQQQQQQQQLVLSSPPLPSWKIHDALLGRRAGFSRRRHLQQQQQQQQQQDSATTTAGGGGGEEEDGADEGCTGAPFLWNIIEASSGEHVGFGVGTVHLPVKNVYGFDDGSGRASTHPAWRSQLNAVADSCAVYGELNVLDPDVIDELVDCASDIAAAAPGRDAVYLSDIPDEELRGRYLQALADIAEFVLPGDSEAQMALVEYLSQQNPLQTIIGIIQIYNTPEIRDNLVEPDVITMDEELLREGRPAGGLESTETQCEILELIAESGPTSDNFLAEFDDRWRPLLEEALTSSMSDLIQAYRCGNTDDLNFDLNFDPSQEGSTDAVSSSFLLDDRNVQMAGRMSEILVSSRRRPLFAVGLAHWMIGENSLENLLRADGYNLERVIGNHAEDALPDIPDAICAAQMAAATTETTTDPPAAEITPPPSSQPQTADISAGLATENPAPTAAAAAASAAPSFKFSGEAPAAEEPSVEEPPAPSELSSHAAPPKSQLATAPALPMLLLLLLLLPVLVEFLLFY